MRVEEQNVIVRVGAQSGCPVCDSGNGCGAGLFGKLLKRQPLEISVPNTARAFAGQAVSLGISESLFLRLVVRLYGLTLVAGILGTGLAHKWAVASGFSYGLTDLFAMCGGALAALLALKFQSRTSTPDISSADIRLMAVKNEILACDVPQPGHQINENEV